MNVELIKTQAGQYENDLYSIHREYAPAQGTPGHLDHAPGGYDWIVSQKRWDDDGDVCYHEVVRHNTLKQAKADVRHRTRSLLHAAPVMLSVLERLRRISDNPNAVLVDDALDRLLLYEGLMVNAGQAIDLAKGFRRLA